MVVEGLANFFVDIKEDVWVTVNKGDKSKEVAKERISSLAYRIFGLLGLVLGGIASVVLVASLVWAPLTNTLFLIIGVASILISYDHIIIGCNKRKLTNDWQKLSSQHLAQVCSGAFSLSKKIYKETSTGVPVVYEGTILYKLFYSLFNDNIQAQKA
ncbi:MAG: hypothetical protein AAGG81_04540 [Chlamydiota bacterium]